jgi:hypothetical protein
MDQFLLKKISAAQGQGRDKEIVYQHIFVENLQRLSLYQTDPNKGVVVRWILQAQFHLAPL